MVNAVWKAVALVTTVCGAHGIATRSTVAPNVVAYVGQQVVQILGADTAELKQEVTTAVKEVFQKNYSKGGITALVTPDQIDPLKNLGLEVNIVVEDVADYLTTAEVESDETFAYRSANSTDPTDPDGYFQKYHPYTAVYEYLDKITNTTTANGVEQSWIVKKKIGKTLEKRPIWAIEVGNQSAKYAIFMEGGIHANEWGGNYGAQYVVTQWINKYASGEYSDLFNEILFVFVPLLNVDGYRYTYKTERLWRKNRSVNNNASCPGVDLNRNYNGFNGWKLMEDECSSSYGGPEAFSEPETKVMVKYLDSLHSKYTVLAMFDMHTYAEYIVYPYGYDFNLPAAPNLKQLKECGNSMADAMNAIDGQNYTAFNAADWYPASGAADDYWYDKVASGPWAENKGLVFTVEMRPQGDDPIGFVLPPSQLLLSCKEAFAGYQAAVDYVVKELALQ